MNYKDKISHSKLKGFISVFCFLCVCVCVLARAHVGGGDGLQDILVWFNLLVLSRKRQEDTFKINWCWTKREGHCCSQSDGSEVQTRSLLAWTGSLLAWTGTGPAEPPIVAVDTLHTFSPVRLFWCLVLDGNIFLSSGAGHKSFPCVVILYSSTCMLHVLKGNENKNCAPSTSTINWLCEKIPTSTREEMFFLTGQFFP